MQNGNITVWSLGSLTTLTAAEVDTLRALRASEQTYKPAKHDALVSLGLVMVADGTADITARGLGALG